MATDVDVDIYESGIIELMHSRWAFDEVFDRGERIADVARAIAPVWPFGSKGGALSIHSSVGTDSNGVYAEISWDQLHGYMRYPNAGTKFQRPQKFMERALEIVMGGIQ